MTKNTPTFIQCTRCVMDTTDPEIIFDNNGVCSHCHFFDRNAHKVWWPNETGKQKLDNIINLIKEKNAKKTYDCIMGISGGVDSSYLALVLKEYELRVLAVHVDAGWNSEMAVSNIENVINHCNFDLHTHVVNWADMKKLQLAYLKSGLANQDVPQDHVFFAVLYKYAIKSKNNIFMSGGNVATEYILPRSWHADSMDRINLRAIYKIFGEGPLEEYETISFWDKFISSRLRGMNEVRPLNFMPYTINKAIPELEKVGWRNYGRKHGESFFTKFFQNYYLPERYGYDKRIAHLSSRILSGEITRTYALEVLKEPLYDSQELNIDKKYFCKKMGITLIDLENLINAPHRYYNEFPNWDFRLKTFKFLTSILAGIKPRK